MTCNGFLLLIAALPLAHGRGGFLAVNPASSNGAMVQATLDDMLGRGHGVDAAQLANVKAALSPLFSVLPKSQSSRLDTPFMRYAVQRYFIQQHGWIVRGFEPHTANLNASEGHAHILHSAVPGQVEDVLTKTLSHGGFALDDVVLAIASIERLILNDGLKGLENAFRLNRLSSIQPLMKETLSEVLTSYFIIEHLDGNATDLAQHQMDKDQILDYYPHWPETLNFIEDIAGDDTFERKHSMNPFVETSFHFDDVARITQTISERFGPLSNHECHDMKMKLAEMDVHGTGRVKLSDFYRSSQGGAWQFLETSEYLSTIGALDTSSDSSGPQVIIPNYITGMNNCISSSHYYDICCLNECDGIFHHLEAQIQAPSASASEITRAIEQGIALSPLLSSSVLVEPRNLSASLSARLQEIAAHHGDAIPLHGRLFAQWLHYTFPQECPYPHMSGTVTPLSVSDLKKSNVQMSASAEEMRQHIESEAAQRAPSPDAGTEMWMLQEELLGPVAPPSSTWRSLLRTAAHITMVILFSAMVGMELTRRIRPFCMGDKNRKEYHI